MPTLRFIDTAPALVACVEDLRNLPSIAFDLEFDSHLRTYGVTLCLIQIATPGGHCYIIDPLAGLDLAPVWTLLEDAAIQKLVHSPGEDLRLLHSLRCYPANLFDTEIPARLLNYERTSLTAVLEDKLGLSLPAGQQRSNWLRRPLTHEQLTYAAADAAYLHALKTVLDAEAAEQGLTTFVLDEQAALSATRFEPEARTTFLKPADFRNLSPWAQHVLQAMLAHRDALARAENKPAFRIIDEAFLRSLAPGETVPQRDAVVRALDADYKTSHFADDVTGVCGAACAEADRLGLSKSLSPRPRLTSAEHRAREIGAHDRKEKFAPVQAALAGEYGVYAARFMLSNGLVGDLVSGKVTLSGLGRPVRKQVIEKAAAALGIDLGRYA